MRRPWWLWLATASFVGYFVFLHLSVYYERETVGLTTSVRPGGIYIRGVLPGYAADRVGMRAGDRIVSVSGLEMDNGNDFSVAVANVRVNEPEGWQLERDGALISVTTPPLPRRWIVPQLMFILATVVFGISLALGNLVLWRGPTDGTTRLGGWLLMSLSCLFLPLFPNSMATEWRSLPAPIQLLLAPAAVSSTAAHLLLLAFSARVSGWQPSRVQTGLAMLPGIAIGAVVAWFATLTFYAPARAVDMPFPRWLNFVGPMIYVAYFLGCVWLLVAGGRRTVDVTERRRIHTLLAGIAAGTIGLFIFALSLALTRTSTFVASGAVSLVAVALFSCLPISFAYATLRHRLFDVRVIVRLGLQYALARGLIVALIPVTIAALVLDAVWHGDQPLRAILADRGWTYATIVGIATIIYVKRDAWMDALDRRFFRERYAAQQILKEVVEDIGRSSNFDTGAQKVIGRIHSALHPVMAAVMKRPRTATAFSAAAKSPDGAPLTSLVAGNAVTQVVRALGRPVVFGTQGLRDIPADQQRWLAESRVEVVVPIATDSSRDEAVLVLGPRRSEEPYSREDLDLLATIGASLGLLMSRSDPAETITVAPSAQRIGHRYRIERQIGEGGMGMVFAAVDETLERRVAIKVIRDQHLTGDALSRFQREARTAASLSHPNIVTIHDFGTDDAGSPFLVMELLEGRSLRHAIKTDGRMAPARALAILSGLSAGVDAAHARGIIHRDLKPENVFLTTGTHPKILDYGIAKNAGATGTNTTGGVLGTLAYMAPEQAAGGGEASPAWDVWALSVMAFEMLAGQHPFGGGLPIIRAVPIRTLAPELEESIAQAIDQSLTLTATDRYAVFSLLRAGRAAR